MSEFSDRKNIFGQAKVYWVLQLRPACEWRRFCLWWCWWVWWMLLPALRVKSIQQCPACLPPGTLHHITSRDSSNCLQRWKLFLASVDSAVWCRSRRCPLNDLRLDWCHRKWKLYALCTYNICDCCCCEILFDLLSTYSMLLLMLYMSVCKPAAGQNGRSHWGPDKTETETL